MNCLLTVGQIAGDPRGESTAEHQLIELVAEGNADAFQTLMQMHMHRLLILAERITGNAADADEVVQDAFLKAWQAAPRWRHGQAKISTWLYRVVLNGSIDRKRRSRCVQWEEENETADAGPTGLDGAVALERSAAIYGALERLPASQRAALSLFYFGEMRAEDVADVLDTTLSAVESLLVRGRRSLKIALMRAGIAGIDDLL